MRMFTAKPTHEGVLLELWGTDGVGGRALVAEFALSWVDASELIGELQAAHNESQDAAAQEHRLDDVDDYDCSDDGDDEPEEEVHKYDDDPDRAAGDME